MKIILRELASSPLKKLVEAGLNIRAVNLDDMGGALLPALTPRAEDLGDGSESQWWACESGGEGGGVGEGEEACSGKVATLRDDSFLSWLFGDRDSPACQRYWLPLYLNVDGGEGRDGWRKGGGSFRGGRGHRQSLVSNLSNGAFGVGLPREEKLAEQA